MRTTIVLFTSIITQVYFSCAIADGRPDHFKGKPAATLAEAVINFSEYNHKLEEIISGKELTPQDLLQVHELTYTLENALERINVELDGLAESLEAVHIASEQADAVTVITRGRVYLDTARKLVE